MTRTMKASLLDGKHVASVLQIELQQKINILLKEGVRPPGLAVILVGQDPASAVYVQHKRRACQEMGFYSEAYHLNADTTETELLSLIKKLNDDPSIDGILVQLPLPKHINPEIIIEQIHPHKDVDGFHPYNLGRLSQGNPTLRPCTPYGIMTLLEYYQIAISGQNAVVIGASNIVGRPMALELLNAKATVTICHRATHNLEEHIRQATLIIVAAGVQEVVKPEWLNPQQIIVDVGIHRLSNGTLRGDVNFTEAKQKVAWITPVPGGIGPMTIQMLLENTFNCYCAHA